MSPKPVPPRRRSRRHADAVMFNYIHELSADIARPGDEATAPSRSR